MKIGLLTFHDTNNFGSYLQAFGLYKKIKDLGYDCEVIDYQCESIIMREVPQPFRFSFNPKRLIIDLLINPAKRKKYHNLLSFLHENMTLSRKVYKKDVFTLEKNYDKIFVGSDIVWGLDITNRDTTYFLDFVKDTKKKFAFSSSIGNAWNNEDKQLVAPFLRDFSGIAVRENESADWVEELTGKRPKTVCDPTMLLSATEWAGLASQHYSKQKYVLVYFPTENSLIDAKRYAKAHQIPCYVINQALPIKGVTNVNPVCLQDFLSLFRFAAFIFTGSYHGMLFSIYFNREFAFYNRAHKSRMVTLATRLGLQDRDASENDVLKMSSINYCMVDAAVELYRDESIQCLKEMLEK